MLLTLGVLTVATRLPVWTLLIGVASIFAVLGMVTGQMDASILSALPQRITGLLEHDLLQALPLYVLVGVLLQRLTLADALFSSLARLLRRTGTGQSLAALGVGLLIAPMNGSVASSSALLARLVGPRLNRLEAGATTAVVSVAATLGVVLPPSLVLILLGDTLMRAHTEAGYLPGYAQGSQRIINTQDVFHAALLPALGVLLAWGAVSWWQGRKLGQDADMQPLPWSRHAMALAAAASIVLLLAGVFTGHLFAVEAAATGGVLLVLLGLTTRALDRRDWQSVLQDTMALSGALFALLVGATTFSLVLRLWGTDRLIAQWILASSLPAPTTCALVLLAVALCAWMLDAFEMIFVVIPIVAPMLILKLGDAQQAAALLLLVLQLSFLLPPMGYAVLMARSQAGLSPVSLARLAHALAPYIIMQFLMIALVFARPALVHQFDAANMSITPANTMTEREIVEQMRQMAPAVEAAPAQPQQHRSSP
jgi:TRAP-type mannitol/chloroaromatic compound transport system permease large subunit